MCHLLSSPPAYRPSPLGWRSISPVTIKVKLFSLALRFHFPTYTLLLSVWIVVRSIFPIMLKVSESSCLLIILHLTILSSFMDSPFPNIPSIHLSVIWFLHIFIFLFLTLSLSSSPNSSFLLQTQHNLLHIVFRTYYHLLLITTYHLFLIISPVF